VFFFFSRIVLFAQVASIRRYTILFHLHCDDLQSGTKSSRRVASTQRSLLAAIKRIMSSSTVVCTMHNQISAFPSRFRYSQRFANHRRRPKCKDNAGNMKLATAAFFSPKSDRTSWNTLLALNPALLGPIR